MMTLKYILNRSNTKPLFIIINKMATFCVAISFFNFVHSISYCCTFGWEISPSNQFIYSSLSNQKKWLIGKSSKYFSTVLEKSSLTNFADIKCEFIQNITVKIVYTDSPRLSIHDSNEHSKYSIAQVCVCDNIQYD